MQITKLIIGTTNPGKLAEWKSFLAGQVEVGSLSDFSSLPKVEETGSTFAENARIKAVAYATALHEFVYSEDGGFEIDALDGWPGVTSHRLTPDGHESSDDEMISYTLSRMSEVPPGQRQARLVCAAAVADPNGQIIFEDHAALEGEVPLAVGPVRMPGYPFRSILYLPQAGKTYAELNPAEHRKFNHKLPIAQRLIKFLSGDIISAS